MGSFYDILSTQLLLVALMGVGVVIAKTGLVDKQGTATLSGLVLNLLLPCNILSSFFDSGGRDMLFVLGQIMIISACVTMAAYFLGKYVFFRSQPLEQQKVLRYGILISNAAYLGNPVIESIYGLSGLIYASAFLMPMRLIMWSLGLAIFTGKGDGPGAGIKKIILHPCLVATYAGLVILVSGWKPPALINRLVFTVGDCTTPFSMIVVGLILARIQLRNIITKTVLYYTFLRLLFIPLMLLGVLLLLNADFLRIDPLVMGIAVALTGMPAPAAASIMANKYHSDSELASKMLLVSVLLSMLTIPAWVILIRAITLGA
ncbi:permease [Spirochaetia bacterium]|nr:permease [Spirochaetia bacterium]